LHVCEIAKLLLPEVERGRHESEWLALLDLGKIEDLIERIDSYVPRRGKKRKEALLGTEYLRGNADRMRYAAFRSQGFFVGSGVVEAGCRTVIAQRLKKSGMFWSLAGANAIIAARCCLRSRRLDDFWEERAAGQNPLPCRAPIAVFLATSPHDPPPTPRLSACPGLGKQGCLKCHTLTASPRASRARPPLRRFTPLRSYIHRRIHDRSPTDARTIIRGFEHARATLSGIVARPM